MMKSRISEERVAAQLPTKVTETILLKLVYLLAKYVSVHVPSVIEGVPIKPILLQLTNSTVRVTAAPAKSMEITIIMQVEHLETELSFSDSIT